MQIRVNAAMSADGKLSTRERKQIEISGDADFDRVERLRADSDAVMVGVGTVVADDPSLTVDDPALRREREAAGRPPNPARVVADSRIRTPHEATILDDAARTYVLTSEEAPQDFVVETESRDAEVICEGESRVDLRAALTVLEDHGIEQLLVEGGGELIYSLFEADLVDELSVYVGNVLFGGRDAPTLADGDGFVEDFPTLELESCERLDDGLLLEWTPHYS
jgi:2,5-diamino-6-(ribosylamino)-4(3H)-pyrimidinone 5'-phosphate reductase